MLLCFIGGITFWYSSRVWYITVWGCTVSIFPFLVCLESALNGLYPMVSCLLPGWSICFNWHCLSLLLYACFLFIWSCRYCSADMSMAYMCFMFVWWVYPSLLPVSCIITLSGHSHWVLLWFTVSPTPHSPIVYYCRPCRKDKRMIWVSSFLLYWLWCPLGLILCIIIIYIYRCPINLWHKALYSSVEHISELG